MIDYIDESDLAPALREIRNVRQVLQGLSYIFRENLIAKGSSWR